MQYKFLAFTLTALLAGCGQDDLQRIKQMKIPDYDLSWEEAAEQFPYCQAGTQKWEKEAAEKSPDNVVVVLFSCTLTPEAIQPYNARIDEQDAEEVAEKVEEKEKRIADIQGRIDEKRPRAMEAYVSQCKGCRSISNEELDEASLAYYKDINTSHPLVQEMIRNNVFVQGVFFGLGEDLNRLQQVSERETGVQFHHPRMTEARLLLEIIEIKREKEKKTEWEYSSSLEYSDDTGKTDTKGFIGNPEFYPEKLFAKGLNPITAPSVMPVERNLFKIR